MEPRVDWRASASLLGSVIKYVSLSMFVPLVIAVAYGEDIWPFVVSLVVAASIGTGLERLDRDPDMGTAEALVLVSTAWLGVAGVGALPYLLAGYGTASVVGLHVPVGEPLPVVIDAVIHSVVNALFESMSGFTTTGATVLEEIGLERHSHALLMWRQLTQWLGGMGIIVLMIAILPELTVNGAQLMQSETPGPALQKLTPKIARTARVLWAVYLGVTIAYIALLYGLHLAGVAPEMTLYQAVAHGFSTLPTGGFSPKAQSIAAFSAVVQWVVIPFVVLAGVNFALLWHVVRGEFTALREDAEIRAYLGAVGVLVAVTSAVLYGGGAPALELGGRTAGAPSTALRQAAFQIASLLNSTGFATANFAQWDTHTQLLLVLAMFVGGSAGSTGGGIKVIRWLVTLRAIRRELYKAVYPSAVRPVRLGGAVVDEDAVRSILAFTLLYLGLLVFAAILIALDTARAGITLSSLEIVSASLATLGNIGPGFGRLGPFGNYLFFPLPSKLLMIALMWVGRLEIVPVLAVLVGLRGPK